MIPTTTDIDHYLTTTHHELRRYTAGLHDLIDCGSPDNPSRPRPPGVRDRAATDRTPSARDNTGELFDPTPKTAGRRSPGHRSDPTGRAVTRWEDDVEQAVTRLYTIVTDVAHTVDGLGLTCHDPHGQELEPPQPPPTRETARGDLVVVAAPSAARRHVTAATSWLASAVDALADRMRTVTDGDVGDGLWDQASQVGRQIVWEARRVAPDRPRLCGCGCRRPLAGSRRPVRDACQKRLERARAAS